MADFRMPKQPDLDSSFTRLSIHPDEDTKLDLWGGGPPPDNNPLKTPELADPSIADVVEITDTDPPSDKKRRRFRLRGKKAGKTMLTARTDDDANADYAHIEILVHTHQAFIARLAVEGAATARKYNLPISIMLAQACLESTYGESAPHAQGHNALFGITKRSELSAGTENDWYPRCQAIFLKPTKVQRGLDDEGKPKFIVVSDRFCGASSYQEAVEIWGQYVFNHPASKSHAGLFKGGPWSEEQLNAIANHMPALMFGSADTQASYGPALMKIIKYFNLTQYDE